ncbi:3-deoxy-D-manno-octulosonic acid transferase [Pseudaestuariivita sp.]|uniref:3-deoxy-D-manno-octulosonic acid transferase n=1 Tax=Pseudaestuariivita sp. TaxID=2211669 RepID=UPI004059A7A4
MLIYGSLITLAWPVVAVLALVRVLRGQESWRDLRQRLGRVPGGAFDLWVHGASNGELASAEVALRALRTRYPEQRWLITANTVTGRALVEGWDLPRTTCRLAPVDARWASPTLPRRPTAHLTLEAELWPHRLRAMRTVVLGARLSEKTARGWSRIPGLASRVFPKLALVVPQDAGSAARFAELGLAPEAMTEPLQLKALYTPKTREAPAVITDAAPRSQVWLAASTHPGEEEIVLDAHLLHTQRHPGARLILAPRHPKRAAEIAEMVASRGLSFVTRSSSAALGSPDVLLADTMGEMDLWYAAAAVTFVGGSLAPRGGHTPFEPAAHGSAILHGPDTANFAETYAALQAQGGAREVTDAEALAEALDHLSDPAQRTAQVARAEAALRTSLDPDSLAEQLSTALFGDTGSTPNA